jgi:hypothetical protein
MIDFIEESSIPVCMVGLLFALPKTQLTRRLAREGRLHPNHEIVPASAGDQCTTGLNFDTLRPLRDVLQDYREILAKIYDPVAYAARLERLMTLLDLSGRIRDLPESDIQAAPQSVHRIATEIPEARGSAVIEAIINQPPAIREPFRNSLAKCAKSNPAALPHIIMLMAFYLHLGPYARHVIALIDQRIAGLGVDYDEGPAFSARGMPPIQDPWRWTQIRDRLMKLTR